MMTFMFSKLGELIGPIIKRQLPKLLDLLYKQNPFTTIVRWMPNVKFHNPKLFPNPLFHLTLRSSINLFFIIYF